MLIILKLFLIAGISQAYLMGDMMIDESQQKGANLLHVELWEDGILPVQFESYLSEEKRKMFMDACNEWSEAANVKCVEGSHKGRIVQVTSFLPGCWALWGMGTHFGVMERQINLSTAENCWSTSTILHELGHAFGLIHEHQRPDRDNYIQIKIENMKFNFLGLTEKINFDKQDVELSTPYDFQSIMHYFPFAGSKNGRPTIVPKFSYRILGEHIGSFSLSDKDKLIMSKLYGKPN